MIAKLNRSLAQIEAARKNFVETVDGLGLSIEDLGRLAAMDDALSDVERGLQQFIVDKAMEISPIAKNLTP